MLLRDSADKAFLPDREGLPGPAVHARRIGKGAARTVLSREQGRWTAASGAPPTREPWSRRRSAAAAMSGKITAHSRPRHACPCCLLCSAYVALLLGALTALGDNTLPCTGLQPVPALEAVVKDVHDLWQKKRPYFLASELEWTPKYAEEDVGITAYVRHKGGSPDGCKGRGPRPCGIIKALWHDFVVQEVRLSDGSLVGLPLRPDPITPSPALGATEEGRYVKFVLALLGIDTIAAVRRLADYCRAPYSAFRFVARKGEKSHSEN